MIIRRICQICIRNPWSWGLFGHVELKTIVLIDHYWVAAPNRHIVWAIGIIARCQRYFNRTNQRWSIWWAITKIFEKILKTIFHLLNGNVVVLCSRKGNEYTDIRRQKCSSLENDVQRLEQCVGLEMVGNTKRPLLKPKSLAKLCCKLLKCLCSVPASTTWVMRYNFKETNI